MKKILACILAMAMVAISLAACGGGGDSSTAASGGGSSAGGSSTADSGGGDSNLSAYDQLMAMEDVLPLSGVQPTHLDSRAGVDKALPVEPKEELTIGWAAASMGSNFFTGMMESAREAAEGYGYILDEQNANFDLALQQQQMDTFITNKVDAIVLNAVDLHSMTNDIKRAVDAGIPVIVTGPTAARDDYQSVTTILSGSNASGFEVGAHCAEELYEKGEVLEVGMTISKMSDADSNSRPCGWISGFLYKKAEMDGTPYDSTYDAILEGYNYWLKFKADGKLDISEEGLNFVGLGVGDGTDAVAGQKASTEILTANPNMDLLVVEMDSQLDGVLPEIRQHGRTPGNDDLRVVTCADGTRQVLELIKSGEVMATATNIPYYNGKGAMDLINRIYSGEDLNDMPANSFTPTTCVNAGNVDDYYDANIDFAKYDEWAPLTTDEYNKLHEND